jgi:hypothetical protein
MTADEIKRMIERELESEPDKKNVFGLDLTKCLIEPIRQNYQSAGDPAIYYELWTVLEEQKDKSGYKIYYDEETGLFGLAIRSNNGELLDIGSHGTFLETLYGM